MLVDTGASRSIISEDFAQGLYNAHLREPGSSGVRWRDELHPHDQLPCLGIQQGSRTDVMKRVIGLTLEFQSPRKLMIGYKQRKKKHDEVKSAKADINFAEVPGISEHVLIGGEDSVALGLKPHEDTIEFDRIGETGITVPRIKMTPADKTRIELTNPVTLCGQTAAMHYVPVNSILGEEDSADTVYWVRPRGEIIGGNVVEQSLSQCMQGGDCVQGKIMIAVQGCGEDIDLTPGQELFEIVSVEGLE